MRSKEDAKLIGSEGTDSEEMSGQTVRQIDINDLQRLVTVLKNKRNAAKAMQFTESDRKKRQKKNRQSGKSRRINRK